MKGAERKAAIAAYKERKVAAGVYAVRCTATGQCWVGRSPALPAIRNRLWFGLRQGNDPHRSLQAAWTAHGADAFSFAGLERLPEDTPAMSRTRLLAERLAHWQAELGAEAL
jgi:hypothetical protein